jgi:hypothetical protein
MKPFLERLAARDELGRVGGRSSFRDLGMGETAALSHSTLLMALSKIEGLVEGNAEPRFFEAGLKQVAEKTSPGALEREKGFHGLAYFSRECFAESRQ